MIIFLRKYKNRILTLFFLALIAGLTAFGFISNLERRNSTKTENSINSSNQRLETQKTVQPSPIIPASALLTVPYTVQAPNQSWNIHEESCEEAVVLMSKLYLDGQSKDIDATTASKKMLQMKSWQKEHYGTEPDLTIAKIGAFGKSYYGLNYKYLPDFTTNNIKELITAGHPVIVPVMTHSLQNPNYGRQTTYHVLLIKGYDAKGVITNDPGISKGKNYFYTWDILYKAVDAQKSKLKQGRDLVYFY